MRPLPIPAPIFAILTALALASPAAGLAQTRDCALPAVLPRPTPVGPTDREPKRLLPVAGYTLALEWSPEYCRTHSRDPRDRIQCGGGNRFGFILHGLWPDGRGRDWPQYCRPAALLPEPLVRANLCATPSVQLLQHEWAKHGTCTGMEPARYFSTATGLFSRIAYPDMAALSRRRLDDAAFRGAFAQANPGMAADMIRLHLDRGGWLQEVRLCLGTDLRPRRCPATGEGASSPAATVRIDRVGAVTNVAPRSPRRSRSQGDGDRDGGG